ncbi:MAG: NADPH-dependent FMN reductase [Cytophagaceae bacterium]
MKPFITIISATNRVPSYSIKIAEYYKLLLENKGAEVNIIDLSNLPPKFIFSALYDNVGKDEEFNKLISSISESNKIIFIVPEYNGSFPGVLKAFLDGLSFPNTLKNKKGALVGISSGVMAGALALSHLTDILNYLGMHVLAIKPRLPRIDKLFVEGKINDEFLTKLINAQIESFLEF